MRLLNFNFLICDGYIYTFIQFSSYCIVSVDHSRKRTARTPHVPLVIISKIIQSTLFLYFVYLIKIIKFLIHLWLMSVVNLISRYQILT